MGRWLFILGVGLLPFWAAVVITVASGGIAAAFLVVAPFACAITLPITVLTWLVYSRAGGGILRRLGLSAASLVLMSGAVAAMYYGSDFATDRREAEADRRLATEFAQGNAELARVAGATAPLQVDMMGWQDARLDRALLGQRRRPQPSRYRIDVMNQNQVLAVAIVVVTRKSGTPVAALECALSQDEAIERWGLRVPPSCEWSQ
jgi:hypothetical protein